jgi:hypothetical protein
MFPLAVVDAVVVTMNGLARPAPLALVANARLPAADIRSVARRAKHDLFSTESPPILQ